MFPPPGQHRALQPTPNGFMGSIARLHASQLAQLGAFSKRLREQSRRTSSARPRPLLAGCSQHVAYAAAFGVASLAGSGFNPLESRGGTRRLVRRSQGGSSDFGAPHRRTTDILLAINVVCYAAQLMSKGSLMMAGAKVNHLIAAGQYWRLITPAFLHANLMHLAVNCYSLNNLGPSVEMQSGGARFAAVYAVSAVGGTALSYIMSPNPSVGASGAIFGIGGALAVFYYRHRDFFGTRSDVILKSLGQSLLLNVIFGASSANIDNWGHMGGLVGGALAAYLLGPKIMIAELPDPKRRGRMQRVVVDRPPLPLLASPPKGIN